VPRPIPVRVEFPSLPEKFFETGDSKRGGQSGVASDLVAFLIWPVISVSPGNH